MPEDQGVNGDKWTSEANRFFNRLGWEKIADSNIDIEGKEGLMHGIDSIFIYEDGFRPDKHQVVFLEAKRYKTTSLPKQKIAEWIEIIDKKLREITYSEAFYDQYPKLAGQNINCGILAIWFHDYEEFPKFRDKINQYLEQVKVPKGRVGSAINRLFYLDNDGILRIASIFSIIDEWKANNISDLADCSIRFYYPSSVLTGFAVQELEVLNIEYIYSKFIFAKANEIVEGKIQTADIVFYFGPTNKLGYFYRLREALLKYDMISSKNKLHIYLYNDHDDFRKIEPEVKKEFLVEGPPNVIIKQMDTYSNLPKWIKNQS